MALSISVPAKGECIAGHEIDDTRDLFTSSNRKLYEYRLAAEGFVDLLEIGFAFCPRLLKAICLKGERVISRHHS